MSKNDKQDSPSQQNRKINKNALIQAFTEHGRIPPQAVDLEEAVLGACMLQTAAYEEIGHILTPECFYKEAHQIIYNAIEILSGKNEPIDILTVNNQLKSTGESEFVGGAYYVTTLTNRVANTTNIVYHSMIIYQKFVQREMIRLCSNVIQQAYEDSHFDNSESVYISATETIDNLLAGKRADKDMLRVMKDHEEEVIRRIEMSKNNELTGIRTGISRLNNFTNGWKPGELIIVAGRPGMGKTAVALNLFTKYASSLGKRTLFFSLEMDDLSLADRLVCSYGGINADKLKTGNLDPQDIEAYYSAKRQLEKLPISIDDSARVDIKHISTISRSKKRKGKCDMIVIDYLQLIESKNDDYRKNREREVAEMSRSLKLLAKELKVPVMLLCQLNRAVESRGGDMRPKLGDLRESGAIEQDADMVIFPYRPEYYGITEDLEGNSLERVMVMIIAKNRNGRVGDVFANYSPDLTQFFDYDYHREKENDDIPY